MDYREFMRHLGKAGLKLGEFAALMGITPNSISNYSKKGHVPRHLALVAILLGELVDRGIDFRELLARADIAPLPSGTATTRESDERRK